MPHRALFRCLCLLALLLCLYQPAEAGTQPPVLDPIGDNDVDEGGTLTFTISATDPDSDPVTYSASNLPSGASFDPGMATFTWTPGYDQAGTYPNITFTATDPDLMTDDEAITITVHDVNRAPVLDPVGDRSVAEGGTLSFTVSATDPDGDTLTYSASNLPAGASFDPGTATFTWTPDYTQGGSYPGVTFTATDPGLLDDSEAITITVTGTNRAPVLDPVGDKSVAEGGTLSFTVSATDPDGDTLTYSAANLPSGAFFDPGTRTFTWTPDYTQGGSYPNVTFTATDPGLLDDSEAIIITVTGTNRAPVLDPVGDRSVAEGGTLSFTVSATDPDGDTLTYSAANLPSGASFDPGTRTFTWTPGYDQGGSYPGVTFTAIDPGLLDDSESITITVTGTNRAPVLDPVGDRSVAEGGTLSFTVSATDPDGDTLTYSASNLPVGASFDPGTRTFTWTPDYTQAGSYPGVTFTATDPGLLDDAESITITVTGTNRAPVLDPVGDRSVAEGGTLSFTVSATDPDGDTLTYSAANLPSGASFDPGTRTFTWTPGFDQGGSYPGVTFTATDPGLLDDSEAITITVGNTNRAPVLDPVGDRSVAEGGTLSFTVSATDPDGDTLTYSASNLPAGASFDPGTRTFTWTPDYTQGGSYPGVTFTATDPGLLDDSEAITITVGNTNRAPVLDPVGDRSVAEGDTLSFTVSATDPDGDTLTYNASNLPSGASFDPGTATFTWTPDYTQGGSYPGVTFTATDPGLLDDSEAIIITVTGTNRAPVLDPVGDRSVAEGDTLSFTVSATDPDGDTLTYNASNLPSGASFDPGTATFTWTPDYTQGGSYPGVTFTATDPGLLDDSEAITITVTGTNRAPVLDPVGDRSVAEGDTLSFTVSATDPDGDTLTYNASNLPSGASFDPGTATFTWTPDYTQGGSYPGVTFTATDPGLLDDSESITITVTGTNQAPVLDPVGDKSVGEGATLTFTVSATDPDGDTLTYSASNLPSGASFDPGTRTFTWTPGFDQGGSYPGVTFTATDPGALDDSEAITITVTGTNRAPVLDPVGDRSVGEGATLTFTVSATDPDGDTLTYSASNLPSGASFDPGTRTFTWTPGYDQGGSYPGVTFTATDPGLLDDSEAITITVTGTNRAPVLGAIGDRSVGEGATLTFTVSATDPDGDTLTYSADNLPSGASFDPGTRTFTWTPGYDQGGSYPGVTFTATDPGLLDDSEAIIITVTGTNRAPVLDPVGDRSVAEGGTLSFTVSATDPDGDTLTYSASNLPSGASFDPGTRTFTWTPGYDQGGSYPGVTFTATDPGLLDDSESITITVTGTNRAPMLDPVGDKTVGEGVTLTFTVSATDPDGDTLTYSAANLPSGASFDPGTRTFTWTPGYDQGGSYPGVTFTATDPGLLDDSEAIIITVTGTNRAPVLDPVGDRSVAEGGTLSFTVSATDPDGDTLTYSASNLPSGASFDPGTATFTWTPGFDQGGSYPGVTFTATDPGLLDDSESITITVTGTNRAPVLDPVGDRSVAEGGTLSFTVSATDPDGDTLTYSASNLPAGASFDPGTATFTWTPDYTQAGTYANISFTATDPSLLDDSEAITITVGNTNRAPVLDPVGDKAVSESQTLTFAVSATDPDGDTLTYSAANLPSGASFDPGTRTFTWTPGYDQGGSYPGVTFIATDPGALDDSEAITITVGNINRPPVLGAIGDKTIGEGSLLSFTVSATDPDGDALTYAASNLPSGASFDPGTATFTWTPSYDQEGTYAGISFTVTDPGLLSDSDTITVTVTATNRAPVFDPIGNKSVDEGQTLTFTVSASDPDGDSFTYGASGLPPGASFDPGTRTFTWSPSYTQQGNHLVTFTATDTGSATGSEPITITVVNINDPPVLSPIGNKNGTEGVLLTFTVVATDPDGDDIIYSGTNLPSGASIDPDTGVFTWTPGFGQAGTYTGVGFLATDTFGLSAGNFITITVGDVNQPPVLDPIGDRSVGEGATLTFIVSATDPDGDTLIYSASNLPSGASFDPGTRTFTWTPDYTQAGTYTNVSFTATDPSLLEDSEAITITVAATNRAPVLAAIGDKAISENQLLTFTISASDPDGDTLTYSAANLPAGASFDPGTATFTWTPAFDQAGSYPNVTFTATDTGALADSEAITITVSNINRAPVLGAIGDKSVNENQPLTFTISATDPDGDTPSYSASNLPSGASFDPGTATFTWTPTFEQSGSYANVTFTATDPGLLTDSEAITINVANVNGPPVLGAIGDKTVDENQLLSFTISATDPDGDDLIYSGTNLPTGASIDPDTGVFTWTPGFDQAGTHANVTFTATDPGALADSEAITITVNNINRAPVLDPIGGTSGAENQLLSFTVSATDPDGDTVTYSAAGLPAGATFDPATRTFTWTPTFDQAGSYAGITFTATDPSLLEDSEAITITITATNRAPVLEPIGDKAGSENQPLAFTISATDPDGDTLIYSAANLPAGASFDPGTATFTWTPAFDQSGSYANVTFTATDPGALDDSEAITITVSEVNRAPVLAPIGDKTGPENQLLSFTISATDPDGDTVTYSAAGLPTGASFDPGTATFTWTPTFEQEGAYANVSFTATDPGALADSEAITITISHTNAPPVLDPVGDKAAAENTLLTFVVHATDLDGETPTYSANGLPAGATFDPGTATFTWTPGFDQTGTYPGVTFTATDPGALADSETITITVADTGRPPVLAAIGDKTVDETQLLTFTVSAIDPDGDPVTYSAAGLPAGATFDPGTATFTWTPTYDQAGSYPNVTFTATDPGLLSDSEAITITVTNVNRPPVLAAIGDKTVIEGQELTFTLNATDPDGETLTYNAAGLPTGAIFDPATRTFAWTPTMDQAGSYPNVTFTATDPGALADSEAITITVGAANRPPVLEPIGDKAGAEAQLLSFTIVATDPDIEQTVSYAASGLPSGATFDGTTGLFTWTPSYIQAGSYSINFAALDDGVPMMADSERITITVADMNQPPVLSPIGNKAGKEGTLLQFTISGYDFDLGQTLTFSAANLPAGAIFDPATATFSWTPAYGQQGTYVVTFTATDDGVPQASDSEDVTLIIGYANTPPLLAPIGDLVIDEGQELRFQLAATDPDTGQTLTFSAANLPSGATFDPATAEFLWVPDYSQGGYVYTDIIFSVTDDGVPVQQDSETISITVNDVNAPPVLDPVGNWIVYEGQLLQFQVTASDFDGDNLTFAAGNLPPGATFDPVTQVFTWTPDYDQAGNYRDILFTVTDDGEPPRSDSESIWISVGNVNRPPVLDPIGPLAVDEGAVLQVQITGSDLDVEQTLTFTAFNLPSGATLNPATRLFSWQPAEWQAGNYIVRFKVSDSAVPPESDFEDVTITVGRVNRPPVLDPIGNKGIQESELLQFVITGTDPDNDGLVFSAANLPPGASFEPMTHAFSWIVQPGQRGNYNVTFTVSDSGNPPLTDSETITITVGSINRYPVIDKIGYVAVQVGQTLQLTVTGSDPDGDGLTFSASGLPPGAVFNPLTRVLTWTPTVSGNYRSLFEVTDDGEPPLGASTVATLVASTTPVPHIDQLSPVLAAPLQQVTIFGSNFGSAPGKIRVGDKLYKPASEQIISWSGNRIDFQLRAYPKWPSGKTAVVDVWVIVGGIKSNKVPLTITVP